MKNKTYNCNNFLLYLCTVKKWLKKEPCKFAVAFFWLLLSKIEFFLSRLELKCILCNIILCLHRRKCTILWINISKSTTSGADAKFNIFFKSTSDLYWNPPIFHAQGHAIVLVNYNAVIWLRDAEKKLTKMFLNCNMASGLYTSMHLE